MCMFGQRIGEDAAALPLFPSDRAKRVMVVVEHNFCWRGVECMVVVSGCLFREQWEFRSGPMSSRFALFFFLYALWGMVASYQISGLLLKLSSHVGPGH
jgi:hypothetical protein